MNDFNAKVGERREENVVGLRGLGITNVRGAKFGEWYHSNNLITCFQQPKRRK